MPAPPSVNFRPNPGDHRHYRAPCFSRSPARADPVPTGRLMRLARRPSVLATTAALSIALAGSLIGPDLRAQPAAPANAGYIVTDAATGNVLLEDNAAHPSAPASVTKLMTFLLVHEAVARGQLTLATPVTITAEAANTGGSQVYLAEREVFPVEELLYALIVKSANDVATALAIATAGSRDAFVALMNTRARELGLAQTTFHSPHGLPPSVKLGQQPDISSPRDLATLGRHLVLHTDILRYTSTKNRDFRPGPKVQAMKSHNHLLWSVPGCDGLKTGYYTKAGFSIAATAERNGRRVIVVVLGCPDRKQRDAFASTLFEKGFAALPANGPAFKGFSAPAGSPSPIRPAASPIQPAPEATQPTPAEPAPPRVQFPLPKR